MPFIRQKQAKYRDMMSLVFFANLALASARVGQNGSRKPQPLANCKLFLALAVWLSFATAPALALDYRSGMIPLLDGKASIATETQWRFLEPQAAEALLDWWGQPKAFGKDQYRILGLVVPTSVDPTPETGWAVLLLGNSSGWTQAEEQQAEALRQLSWPAERLAPELNVTDHKLIWQVNNQNFPQYRGQIFGRDSLIELRSVAPNAAQLPSTDDMRAVLGQINFMQGSRYEDYQLSQDSVSKTTLEATVTSAAADTSSTEAAHKPAGPLVWLALFAGLGVLLGLTYLLPRRKSKLAKDEIDELEGVEADELDPS